MSSKTGKVKRLDSSITQDSSKVSAKTIQWSLYVYLREDKGQKVKFTLELSMKARGSRDITVLFQ